MKIVTAKYVYARIGSPSTQVQYAYYRNPGEALSIDRIIQGTMIDGNSIWYHCADDGCFYWSGGFEFTKEVLDDNPYTEHNEENWYIYQSAANEILGIYRHIPGFAGLAAGYKTKGEQNTENISLIFYVNSKTEIQNPQVPKFVNYRGVALTTDVQILGEVRLLSADPDKIRPYIMGGSVASVENGIEMPVGTRSLIVTKNGLKYLLTCYHVACAYLYKRNIKELSNYIVNVNIPSDTKTSLDKIVTSKVAEGIICSNLDYALIELKENIKYFSNYMPKHFFKNGFYSFYDLSNFPNDTQLNKYGVATKYTSGKKIQAFPANNIKVDKKTGLIMSGLLVSDIQCDSGDSGAPVVDQDGKIIGIIVGAYFEGLKSTKTFILPFDHLNHNKHIDIN